MNANVADRLAQLLIAQGPDAVVFADTTGTIQVWNAAAERIFGFTQREALGASLDLIIPERFRAAHWRGFERALAEGTTKYLGHSLPTRALRADGTQIYVELSFSIIVDAQASVIGALAQARDITERFEKERVAREQRQ